MEEWRIIKKFPKYEVSNKGRVRKISTNRLLYLKHHTSGYQQVTIQENNKKYYLYVHKLVAEAFIPNPNDFPLINHKDENKTNNLANNLEWCTPKYNANYGTCKERVGKAHHKRVKQYTKDGLFIKEWNSYSEAEEALGLSKGDISKYVNSEFHWEKIDN